MACLEGYKIERKSNDNFSYRMALEFWSSFNEIKDHLEAETGACISYIYKSINTYHRCDTIPTYEVVTRTTLTLWLNGDQSFQSTFLSVGSKLGMQYETYV